MDAGHEVLLLDNLSNSLPEVVNSIERITSKKVQYVKGDIRDSALLAAVMRSHQINAVVHCAGLKAVGDSVRMPLNYYSNNVHGTISLLEAMESENVKTLIFSSSATVYGEPTYLPVDEKHPVSATNPYGRSKLQIEEILRDVANADSQMRVVCLRYFNPAGAHPSGLIGERSRGSPNNLIPLIAQVAAGEKESLDVFGADYATPDGTGIRDYIHVTDLAAGHLAALDFADRNIGWNVFNLGTGRGYSVLELIETFKRVSGREVIYRITPRREGDVAICYANPSKAKLLLGWQAMREMPDMCSSSWIFQKNLL
jgi:UDP-glucose 4-epimerase